MVATDATYDKVLEALHELERNGVRITVKAVARAARIARATIYNDPRLRDLVQQYERQLQFHAGYQRGLHDGRNSPAPNLGRARNEEWARGILHIAPDALLTTDLLKRQRAKLSRFLHPDQGGDTELQKTINQAFDILKRKAA